MTEADSELLLRLRDGDERAFDLIVERFERRLIGYFSGMSGGDQQLAEDCAQEVLVRVYRARETYTRYFGVKYVSLISDYSVCAQTCPRQQDVMRDMSRDAGAP